MENGYVIGLDEQEAVFMGHDDGWSANIWLYKGAYFSYTYEKKKCGDL